MLPGATQTEMEILFPEHVTAKKKSSHRPQHLYLFRPRQGDKACMGAIRTLCGIRRHLLGDIHMLVRATLQDDGVLFHYECENRSNADYAMITAVTDPRMTGIFS
jgi:hypothetical protein